MQDDIGKVKIPIGDEFPDDIRRVSVVYVGFPESGIIII